MSKARKPYSGAMLGFVIAVFALFITVLIIPASREVFAAGAVRAISYINCKEPGLYNMMGMVQELNAKG